MCVLPYAVFYPVVGFRHIAGHVHPPGIREIRWRDHIVGIEQRPRTTRKCAHSRHTYRHNLIGSISSSTLLDDVKDPDTIELGSCASALVQATSLMSLRLAVAGSNPAPRGSSREL
jgi:hypothetical protein